MGGLDLTVNLLLGVLSIGALLIIWSYARGLRASATALWLLLIVYILENTASSAANKTMSLWLSADCGLGDVSAGAMIGAWSIGLSLVSLAAGSLVDAFGLKRTLAISLLFMIAGRFAMIWCTDPLLVMAAGFVPLAIGLGTVVPAVHLGVKRFTSTESNALAFGLFYVLMNAGTAVGGVFFDAMRNWYSVRDATGHVLQENAGGILPLLNLQLSTYQLILASAFLLNALAWPFIHWMRVPCDPPATAQDHRGRPTERWRAIWAALGDGFRKTWHSLRAVLGDNAFWRFLLVLAPTVMVRMVFFHFHYTFPKYGLRVLGEGAKIGSLYGVLNPVMIVFLVPLFAVLTRRLRSYYVIVAGTALSASAVFIAALPGSWFAPLTPTWLGQVVFIRWLGLAPDVATLLQQPPVPDYWPLLCFIALFSVGEALWSPRLAQFTLEAAPAGKEGGYLGLSALPFFGAKFLAGPMSGLLLAAYVPVQKVVDAAGVATFVNGDLSRHALVWVWVGGVAVLAPIGLLAMHRMLPKRMLASPAVLP